MGLRADFIPDVERYANGEKKGEPKLGQDGLPFLGPDSEFYVHEELEHLVRQWRKDPDAVTVNGFEALALPEHLEIVIRGFQMYFKNGDPPLKEAFSDTIYVKDGQRCELSEAVIAAVGLIGQHNVAREKHHAA